MSSVSPTSGSSVQATSQSNPGGSIITSAGVGSGIDVNAIVSAIVSSEGAGQTAQLNAQTAQISSQISAYSQVSAAAASVQSAIQALSTPSNFNNYPATVTDTTVASATAGATAVPGNYSLSVSQLAQGTNLQSAAYASASTTQVGTGTLSIAAGSSSFKVTITASNNTLAGIANAINNASGNPGVSASVLTANNGSYLVLSSSVTGAANAVTVTETDGGTGLKGLTYSPTGGAGNGLTQTQAAQDAVISINGLAYNSPSNSISTAISGVTINALKVSANGATTGLTVASNPTTTATNISSFVQAYNSFIQTVAGLTAYNAQTSTSGPLLGDSLTTGFLNQLGNVVSAGTASTGASSTLTSLAQIGVSVNLDGTLSLNSTTLNAALQSNPGSVAALFTNTKTGAATKLNSLFLTYTTSGGLFDQATTALQGSLRSISAQQAQLNDQLTQLQSQLFSEYNAMDIVVARLKATASQLTSELSSLPTNWGPVSSSSG